MRESLVHKLENLGDVATPSVVEAMRLVPREAFVPGVPLEVAYGNFPVEIAEAQTISQPSIVGRMTEPKVRQDRPLLALPDAGFVPNVLGG